LTPEINQLLLAPLIQGGAASTGGGTLLGGATMRVRNRAVFNRLAWVVVSRTGSPTARFLIYQGDRGTLAAPYELIAQATAIAIPAAGLYSTPLDGGVSAEVDEGMCLVLWGRDSVAGNVNVRASSNGAIDLQTANVPSGAVPSVFETTLLSTTAPATVDPTNSLVFVPSIDALAPVLMLRNV
jgi:hypothetical protein